MFREEKEEEWMKSKLKSKLDMCNIPALLVEGDEWRSAPQVARIMSLQTANSGLYGPEARNQGISQLHAPTIVIYTANVLTVFICIQSRILKPLFLETAQTAAIEIWPSCESVAVLDREEEWSEERKEKKTKKIRSYKKKERRKMCLFFILEQGCTNPRCLVAVAAPMFTVTPNICGSLTVELASHHPSRA